MSTSHDLMTQLQDLEELQRRAYIQNAMIFDIGQFLRSLNKHLSQLHLNKLKCYSLRSEWDERLYFLGLVKLTEDFCFIKFHCESPKLLKTFGVEDFYGYFSYNNGRVPQSRLDDYMSLWWSLVSPIAYAMVEEPDPRVLVADQE